MLCPIHVFRPCPTTAAEVAAICCKLPGCVAFALGNRTCVWNNVGPACARQPGGEAASCKASDCSFMQLYSSVKADSEPVVSDQWSAYVNTHAATLLPAPPPAAAAEKTGPCTARETFCVELDVPTATVSITTNDYSIKVWVDLNAPLRTGKPDRGAGILHVEAEAASEHSELAGAAVLRTFSLDVMLEPFREEGRETPLGSFCDPRFEHADTLASEAGDDSLDWYHWNHIGATYQADTMSSQGMGSPTADLPEIFAHRAFGARLAGAGLTTKNGTTLSGRQLSKVDLVATLLTLPPAEAAAESAWLEAIATVKASAAAGTACPGPGGAAATGRACATSWDALMERSYIEVTAVGNDSLAAKRVQDHVTWDRYLSLIQGRYVKFWQDFPLFWLL